jgi:signal transduction histidine kinase
VHKIIEAHGGEVRVDSDVGRGTTVSFLLPVTEG